jgi:hypothetical protein
MVSRLKMARKGSRHSNAAMMWRSEIVVSPIVVATASPYWSSAHATMARVPMAMSRPATPSRTPSDGGITG